MRPANERRLRQCTDAEAWAEEFLAAFGDRRELIDHDLMLGWFANAIENGRAAGRQRGYEEGLAEANERLALMDVERLETELEDRRDFESRLP